MQALVDGIPAQSLPLDDRGLHYGDGLFETIAVREGEPKLWSAHLARLRRGCERLQLPMPDGDLLRAEAARLCADTAAGVLKLLYTRSSAGRGYRPVAAPARRVLMLAPPPAYQSTAWEQGVVIRVCALRLAAQPRLAGLKHLNRLEQVLARAEWDDPNVAEGLMLDNNERVIEATQSNVFLVHGKRLLTPALDRCGVSGVMRETVLALAPELGLAVEETELGLDDVRTADELFLSNSLIGVWPVARLDDQRWHRHPTTHSLLGRLRADKLCLLPEAEV